MKNTLAILQKVLVNHFYKVNSGFFLFVFYVLFGIPQNIKQFHVSLAEGIIKNPSILMLTMLAWMLYNLKCIDYVIKELKKPGQQFLFSLHSLRPVSCYLYLLFVQVLVYAPALIYSVFIIIEASQAAYITCAIEIILFNVCIISFTAYFYMLVLQRRPVLLQIALPQFKLRLPKPLFSLALYHIWHNNKQMLVISKTFSLLLLFVFIKLYQPDEYDIRPTLLCFMLAAAANLAIVFEMKTFEDFFLNSFRNFPLTILRRFFSSLMAFLILLLPELLFLWKGYPLYFTVIDFFQVLLLGTGILSFCYSTLFTGNINMDIFMKIAFGVLIVSFFVILYNPGILLGIVLIIASLGLYASYYYDFEQQT